MEGARKQLAYLLAVKTRPGSTIKLPSQNVFQLSHQQREQHSSVLTYRRDVASQRRVIKAVSVTLFLLLFPHYMMKHSYIRSFHASHRLNLMDNEREYLPWMSDFSIT
jgi:hypothetical protein